MERLKELRQAQNYTQQRIAEMLKTTQQTVARWENGQAEPNLSALRDLAVIFGTSVDDLLNNNPLSSKIQTTSMINLAREGLEDGFWGNLGLLTYGSQFTRWYPITEDTMSKIYQSIHNSEENTWIIAVTLNNRLLVFSPTSMKRMWLLDEACDEPDDWHLEKDDYEGRPLEIYRGLHDYHFEPEAIKAETSDAFIETLQETRQEFGLENEKDLLDFLHYTKIQMRDGSSFSYWAEAEDLYEVFFMAELEQMPAMIKIGHFGGDFFSFYPAKDISVIDMPLVDVIDVAKEHVKEVENEG